MSRLGQVGLFYLMLLWLGAMLLLANIGLLPLLAAPRALREPLVQRSISGLFRLFLGGASRCGLMRLDLRALDALNEQPKMLMVANHPSMIDVFLVVSRVRRAVCIMKASIATNLFFGLGAYLAGYVSNRQPDTLLRSATLAVERGAQLLVFPEGTRSTRQPVNEFKPGFALVARRSGAPMRTILIRSNSPYLAKGWTLWRPPSFPLVYQATLGQQFTPLANSNDTAKTLQAYFEQAMTTSIDPGLRV